MPVLAQFLPPQLPQNTRCAPVPAATQTHRKPSMTTRTGNATPFQGLPAKMHLQRKYCATLRYRPYFKTNPLRQVLKTFKKTLCSHNTLLMQQSLIASASWERTKPPTHKAMASIHEKGGRWLLQRFSCEDSGPHPLEQTHSAPHRFLRRFGRFGWSRVAPLG